MHDDLKESDRVISEAFNRVLDPDGKQMKTQHKDNAQNVPKPTNKKVKKTQLTQLM